MARARSGNLSAPSAPKSSVGYGWTGKPEKKFIDTSMTTDATTTASITLLNGCQLGTSASTRVGRKICIKSIFMRGSLQKENPADGIGQTVRMMIVWDKQPNGAVISSITDLLVSASTDALNNLSNRDRFIVLMDKVRDINPSAGSYTGAAASFATQRVSLKKYLNVKLDTIYNDGNAGTIADIATGALYLIVIGSVAAGTSDVDTNFNVRIRYTDA